MFHPFYPLNFLLNLSPIQNLKEALKYPLECTVSYISQKLCVFQISSPLYSNYPLRFWLCKLVGGGRGVIRQELKAAVLAVLAGGGLVTRQELKAGVLAVLAGGGW